MNRIIYARRESICGAITAKSFELLVFDDGSTVIIPPLKTFEEDFCGIRITFDNAALPFKEVCKIRDSEDGALLFTARQAVRYCDSDDPKRELVLSALGNLLVSLVAAFATAEYSPVVALVLAEIEKGVSDCAFTIKGCLKKLPLNYDYIRKLFKKEVGVTPADYLLKERMSLAQQLILSGISNKFSNYTVSQISEACGYSEPLYFSRVFKKYFGVSPSEYKINPIESKE